MTITATRPLRVGALFAGYSGIELALQQWLDIELAWYAEIEDAPSKIMAHHYPGVTNYRDVTKIKWTPDCPDCGMTLGVYRPKGAETGPDAFYWCGRCSRQWDTAIRFDDPDAHLIPDPIDVLTGGSPCQDLSHAGKRLGMKTGTRSGLWASMREAIATLRPQLVVWENVQGALSAEATSEMEQCPGCMGDGSDAPVLRALGRVLGDLADLRYDAWWYGLKCSDVGGAHGRFRIFLFAEPADSDGQGLEGHAGPARAAQAGCGGHPVEGAVGRGEPAAEAAADATGLGRPGGGASGHAEGLPAAAGDLIAGALLPTPTTQDARGGPSQLNRNTVPLNAVATHVLPAPGENPLLLKTPTSQLAVNGGSQHPDKRKAGGHGPTLADEVETHLLPTPVTDPASANGHARDLAETKLLPTPGAALGDGGQTSRSGARKDEKLLAGIAEEVSGPLLPTPQAHDAAAGKTAEQVAAMRARGHGVANLNETIENGVGGKLLPTPVVTDSFGAARHTTTTGVMHSGTSLTDATRLLEIEIPEPDDDPDEGQLFLFPTTTQRGTDANLDTREGARANLHNSVDHLLSTPDTAPEAPNSGSNATRTIGLGNEITEITEYPQDWREYGAAIRRAERAVGRPAPAPTETGPKGKPRLSPRFVEWMMMLPDGWVTDPAIGITRNEQLRALGNGVVPAQCAAAAGAWLHDRFQLAIPLPEPAEDDDYLLPTPNAFHMGNTETPDEWRARRADVFKRTGTRHGPALSVVALSVLEGHPLVPENYMPDDEDE